MPDTTSYEQLKQKVQELSDAIESLTFSFWKKTGSGSNEIRAAKITGTPITSIPNSTVTDISLLEKSHNLVFSVTDADTIAWGAGTIVFSNGRTFTIDAGNTGNMVALTYIYLDPAVSSTVLQVTTTYSTAMGANKQLIGVAQNQTTTASYIPFTGGGKPLIDGEQLGALSVGSAVIKALAVTTAKIDNLAVTDAKINDLAVSKLSAGTITSKSIVLEVADTTGDVEMRAGIAAGDFANTGAASGFIFGIDDSDSNLTKFYWGNPTRYVKFDGTDLTVNGYALSVFGGDGTDGALTITSGTTTISCASATSLTKNYTSISITGTATLAFSNPHANGTAVYLRSQGAITLTSSSAPMVDCSSLGAAGGAGGAISTAGTAGSNGWSLTATQTNKGGGVAIQTGGVGLGAQSLTTGIYGHVVRLATGAGGAGGTGGSDTAGGAGARGGGGLFIECAGAWNFTTASGISVAGATGTNGTDEASTGGGGGGGGGAGGVCIVLYNTLTANSGTITIAGGTGGRGGNRTVASGGGGGGAGGAGGNGTGGTSNGGNGDTTQPGYGGGGGAGDVGGANGSNGSAPGFSNCGDGGGGGASGASLVTKNIFFA